MRYTVTVSVQEEDKLAAIWNDAPNRAAVTRASNKIDSLLRSSPLEHGLPLGDFRMLTIMPLTVVYSVSPEDCLVTVLDYFYEE
jgi:hypothetical protein